MEKSFQKLEAAPNDNAALDNQVQSFSDLQNSI